MNSKRQEDALRTEINQETSRIAWRELQRHFASGVVLQVADGLDLVEVACLLAADHKVQVAAWIDAGQLARVSDAQALAWYETDAALWAVVVRPYVLVQEEK